MSQRRHFKCIFCGQGNLSKEHVWPNWMREYFPRTEVTGHNFEIHRAKGKTRVFESEKTERQGHLSTTKLRVVCSDCNNVWMNQLEVSAKPILMSILQEEELAMDLNRQAVLARWIAMKSIVLEHSQVNEHITPYEDRSRLRIDDEIPGYMSIYIGRYSDSDGSSLRKHSATFSANEAGPSPPLEGRTRNVQTVAMMIGDLFVFVLTARVDNVDLAKLFDSSPVTRLWPLGSHIIRWPLPRIPQPTIANIAHWLEDLIQHPKATYAGDV